MDWANHNNWYYIPKTKEGILYKSLALSSIPNDNHLSKYLQDIDWAAQYCSKVHYQDVEILKNPNLLKHLKSKKKSKFILSSRCPTAVVLYILENHPSLKNDIDIAEKVLLHNYNNNLINNAFRPVITEKSFGLKLIKKGFRDILYILSIFPQDLQLTKMALKNRLYPYETSQHSKIFDHKNYSNHIYNEKSFQDKKFISQLLTDKFSDMLYNWLPENLQYDEDICKIMVEHHPDFKIKNSPVKTLDQFINLQNFTTWTNYFGKFDSAIKNFSIFDTTEKKNELINYISQNGHLTFDDIDGQAGSSFKTHPLKEFIYLCVKEDKFYEYFIETEKGQITINTIINSAVTLNDYEKNIFPHIGKWINSCYLNYNLSKILVVKNNIKKTSKI